MKEKKWLKWLRPGIPALLMFVLVAVIKKLFEAPDAQSAIGIVADCFTVPGVLLTGVGLITWTATFGQFDMLGYSTRRFFGHFFHGLSADLPADFYEYRKQKNDKGRVWLVHTFLVGIICLGLGVALLVVYFIL